MRYLWPTMLAFVLVACASDTKKEPDFNPLPLLVPEKKPNRPVYIR